MADIDVVPKGRTTTWLWLLATLDLAALLMVVFAGRADASTSSGSPTSRSTQREPPWSSERAKSR